MDDVLCLIYQKGDKPVCGNYRGITLINESLKLSRRSSIVCWHPMQGGSIERGSLAPAVPHTIFFSLRQILEKCRDYNVPTYHISVDFEAAYDTVDCEQLWQIMHGNEFPDKLTV